MADRVSTRNVLFFGRTRKGSSGRGLICYEKLLGSRMRAVDKARRDFVKGVFKTDQLDRGGGCTRDELAALAAGA